MIPPFVDASLERLIEEGLLTSLSYAGHYRSGFGLHYWNLDPSRIPELLQVGTALCLGGKLYLLTWTFATGLLRCGDFLHHRDHPDQGFDIAILCEFHHFASMKMFSSSMFN